VNDLFNALNQARAQFGRPALQWSPALAESALIGAEAAQVFRRLLHWRFGARLAATGLAWRAVGECGFEADPPQPDGFVVVAVWMGDQTHHDIVLGPYTHVGAAPSPDGRFVVADFALLQ
jgi:uncharacterized protein YkwD